MTVAARRDGIDDPRIFGQPLERGRAAFTNIGGSTSNLFENHVRRPIQFISDLQNIGCGHVEFARLAHRPLFLEEKLEMARVIRQAQDKLFFVQFRLENKVGDPAMNLGNGFRFGPEVMLNYGRGSLLVDRLALSAHYSTLPVRAVKRKISSPSSCGSFTRTVPTLPRNDSLPRPTITARPTSRRKLSISVSPAPMECSSEIPNRSASARNPAALSTPGAVTKLLRLLCW